MNKFIQIGVVGAGKNTCEKHIPRFQKIEGVKIVCVANLRRESSERVAHLFAIPAVYDSWEELLGRCECDAIVIGTWPYLHCPITLAALSSGKHVMCEARMAMNAEEARTMLTAAQQHPELITQVVPSPFTLRLDKTVKRLISEGFLGKLLAVEVRATNDTFLDSEAPLHWRQDVELSGLNVMSLGIWYEALMRWIGQAVSVTAKGKVFVKSRYDLRTGKERTVNIPEYLVVLAEMECGAQATFILSNITRHAKSNEAVLIGTEGTLRIGNDILFEAKREKDDYSEILIPPDDAGRWRVEEEFIAAIRGTESITHTTFEDGVKYMEFTEAVAQSLALERTVLL